MRTLSSIEVSNVAGAVHIKIDLGVTLASLAVGIATGGLGGAGIVLCGLVVGHGINKLSPMAEHAVNAFEQKYPGVFHAGQ
jgi:hypothetical protein